MKTIVFAGGGTAGHVMPNVALMEQLKDKCHCVYIGTNGIEKTLVEKRFGKENFFEIECKKLQRKFTLQNLSLPFAINKSIKNCKRILKNLNPSLIFAKGGYASFPVVMAGKKLGIDIFIHESDYTMGLANKLCAKSCKKVFVTFEDTAKTHKYAICTGTPLRQQIYAPDKLKGMRTAKFSEKRKKITVVGGSLGAKRLNEIIEKSVDKITEKYDLFVICGKGKRLDITKKGFAQAEFVDNIFDVFCASDLVISRAGSNAVCELIAMNKPCIFVPLTQATRGEQLQNATYFEKRDCCLVADENTLDTQSLLEKIDLAFKNEKLFKQNMKKQKVDGTQKIVKEILKTING